MGSWEIEKTGSTGRSVGWKKRIRILYREARGNGDYVWWDCVLRCIEGKNRVAKDRRSTGRRFRSGKRNYVLASFFRVKNFHVPRLTRHNQLAAPSQHRNILPSRKKFQLLDCQLVFFCESTYFYESHIMQGSRPHIVTSDLFLNLQ